MVTVLAMTDENDDPLRFVRKVYVAADKDRVRQALLRFEEHHEIANRGKLARLIAKKIERKIPRRTLDRFLKEQFNTDDDFVNYCEMFLNASAPPRPEELVGPALDRFLMHDDERRDEAPALIGHYHVYCQLQPLGGDVEIRSEVVAQLGLDTANYLRWRARRFVPYAHFFIEPMQGSFCFALAATVVNPFAPWSVPAGLELSEEVPPDDPDSIRQTGILIPVHKHDYLAIVRGWLQTSVFKLKKISDEPVRLVGARLERPSIPSAVDPLGNEVWDSAMDVQMTRQASRSAS